MSQFIDQLHVRNGPLFVFGYCTLIMAFICLLLSSLSTSQVGGANAWLKPFKFGVSIAIFSWTMGWFTHELHAPGPVTRYNWIVIIGLGFDVIYIALQAGRGQLSHYNLSSPVYSFLTLLMGVAAALVTCWTGYIGFLFFTSDLTNLPAYYVLSIRLGILLFVFFAFQGASMGARRTHLVGGTEGAPSLPVVNWSTRYGDLRITHFIGMHALQVLPLLSWHVLKNTMATAIVGFLYALLAVFSLVRALQGKALPRQPYPVT